MLFVLITAILSYKKEIELEPYAIKYLPDYFHYKSNGEFFINFDASSQTDFPVTVEAFVCTKKEYKKFFGKDRFLCSIHHLISINSTNITTANISGVIPKKGPYQILLSCSLNVRKVTAKLALKNPGSYLDSYQQPILYWEPIFFTMISILLILWLVNRFIYNCRFSFKQSMHKLLTADFVLTLFTSLFLMLYLWSFHLHDNGYTLRLLMIACQYFQLTFILYSVLVCSAGLDYTKQSILLWKRIQFFVLSAFLSLPPILIGYFSLKKWRYVFFFIDIAFFLAYIYHLYNLFNFSLLEIIAHLHVIAKNGINPTTTPIYNKYNRFIHMKKSVWFILPLASVFVFLFFCINFAFSLRVVITDFLAFVFFVTMYVFFRFSKKVKKGYTNIDNIPEIGQEPEEILRDDVLRIDMTTFLLPDDNPNIELREWSEEDPIPPQPLIVGQKTRSNIPYDQEDKISRGEENDVNDLEDINDDKADDSDNVLPEDHKINLENTAADGDFNLDDI